MTPISRLMVAVAVLAVGAFVGYLLRRRLQPAQSADNGSGLPPGLVVVTAPYCTRCTSLQRRLTGSDTDFATIDAAAQPTLIADLHITTAPTLLAVDASGGVKDREHRDFSDARLAELILAANRSSQ